MKTKIPIIIIISLFFLSFLNSCKDSPTSHYTHSSELDSLFDFEDRQVLQARESLDSIMLKEELDSTDLVIIDSLKAITLTDNISEDLDIAEALQGQYIKRLVIHCTASNVKNPHTKESLLAFFKNYNHWSKPGYTFFIDRDGILWKLNEAFDWDPIITYAELTFGASGFNSTSLHVSWDGGLDGNKIVDNRTEAQKVALRAFVQIVHDVYPNIEIMGHRDLPNVKKACPIFDVKKEYSSILKKD